MKLVEIIGSSSAVSPITGRKAYEYVANFLFSSTPVVISLEGITDFTSAFCNSFIGKIYMDFNPTLVDDLVQFTDLDSESVWKKKLTNAKLLGTNENIRTARKKNMESLLLY